MPTITEHAKGSIVSGCYLYSRLRKKAKQQKKNKGGKRMEWISVKDGLPKTFEPILIYTNGTAGQGRGMLVGTCHNGFWFIQNSQSALGFPNLQYEVTHWMSLPQPPTTCLE